MSNQKKKLKESKNQINAYARFSSIGIQMFAIIAVGSFIGVKLDERYDNENKVFTTVFALMAVVLSIVYVVRRIISDTNN